MKGKLIACMIVVLGLTLPRSTASFERFRPE